LSAVAKQLKKLGGKAMPTEIILVGGASMLIKYGFRDSTYDIDAYIQASSAMKDAINRVTDSMGLPNGWLIMTLRKQNLIHRSLRRILSTIENFLKCL
jgi:predicted nucleotidyltransferase